MNQTTEKKETIRGIGGTFASLRIWDEGEFMYRDAVDFVRGRDARDEYKDLHKPPLIFVLSVRFN